MGSIQEVKEALSAKAQTTSLDELRLRGRNQVRLIRAEHIAQMVAEAVERALADSGLVPQQELQRIVERGHAEFAAVKAERQRDHDEAMRMADELRAAQRALAEAEGRNSEFESRCIDAESRARSALNQLETLQEDLAALEGMRMRSQDLEPELQRALARLRELEVELESHRKRVKEHESELTKAHKASQDSDAARRRIAQLEQQLAAADAPRPQRELNEAQARVAELEQQLAAALERMTSLEQDADQHETTHAATAAQVDVMAQVLEELATLKARVDSQPAPAPARAQPVAAPSAARTQAPDPASAAVDQLTSALQKLTQNMNDKMESFGRKMGISGAVESGPVRLDGIFKDLDSQKVESNLDNLEVKKKQAGGIAANLERLKKLKGS